MTTEQQFGLCRVSIAPLRAEASDRSEIVSQLLFGDGVEITAQKDNWRKIRNIYDEYEGWVDIKQLEVVPKEEAEAVSDFVAPPALENALTAEDGSTYYLVAGSSLPGFSNGNCALGNLRFKLNFQPLQVNYGALKGDLAAFGLFFLNAPYLWGGRTLFGIDCSGFTQTVFKMAGIRIKRDASQQAEEGITVDFLPEARKGDVAFFDNAEGRITHVGILLDNQQIIHASGKVRIDPIDDQGIFNKELNKYTHRLRIIKRFF